MEISLVDNRQLKIPKWGVNSILRPEKMLLKTSMIDYGWIQPIVVKKSDNTIIDGYQRYLISIFKRSPRIQKPQIQTNNP